MPEKRSKTQLIDRARARVQEVGARELAAELAAVTGLRPFVVDVREEAETAAGLLPEARSLPRGFLELRIEELVPDRAQPVVLYCAGGTRSLLAAETLLDMGYQQVRSLRGGFGGWKQAGLPLKLPEAAGTLTSAQRARYSRHLALPEVGEAGQARLLAARVLLVGAGGLGSPVALYLAAAGVGRLGLVDDDVVDASNLQRQVLHTTDRVGMPKTDSARRTLQALNPDVVVDEHRERLDAAAAERLIGPCDVVVDGTDNFPTRYAINEACVRLGKPSVHAAIHRFEGQATTFVPGGGRPCYRCLFPDPPPRELIPNCQEAGVLGALPGLLGMVQAIEVLKLLLGKGELLVGRLLLYDALGQRFRELKYGRAAQCPTCGDGLAGARGQG